MATINDLVFAIDETQKKFDNTFSGVYSAILSGTPKCYAFITSNNGARARIRNIPTTEIVKILVSEIVRIYNYMEIIRKTDPEIINEKNLETRYEKIKEKCPYYAEVRDFVMDMKNPKVNSILYFLNNNANLLDLLTIIEKYHYGYEKKYRQILEHSNPKGKLSNFVEPELIEKINSDYEKISGVRQVQVNAGAINKCVADIISGAQIERGNNSYQVGKNLFASQHIGIKRSNQEDSVLIMEHPKNPNFKILVVSDGIGGGYAGEEVSRYTVGSIANWFKDLNPNYYNNPEELQKVFNQEIERISQNVNRKYNDDKRINAGATFTGAIVTKDKTIITQIGDSRAYIIKDGNIFKKSKATLVTRDESIVWPRDKNGQPYNPATMSREQIDEIRFRRGGNHIIRCIGDIINASKQSFTIPNEAYDKLLLMSDGASDLLSVEGIEIICRNTPLEKIANTIITAAISKDAIRGNEWNKFYEDLSKERVSKEELAKYNSGLSTMLEESEYMGKISRGKDNASVIVFGNDKHR